MGGRSTRAEEGSMVRGMVVGLLLAATPARGAQGAAPPPPAAEGKTKAVRIAVLDVQATGAGDRKTVEGLSPLLASEVARRPGLTVVAGSDLRALVGFERQKQLLGCTEGSCLTEIAGALGVAYLVSSECSKVGSTWLLSLALLVSPADGSGVAAPRLRLDPSDRLSVTAGLQLPFGATPREGRLRSEYGATPLSGFVQIAVSG